MSEIVTIDGKQFELVAEYPLTEQQRQQTISDIRKQSGCRSCNQTQSLGGIHTLVADCIDITVKAPAVTTVKSVTIGISGQTPDSCPSGTCSDITCLASGCTDTVTRDVVVTFENSGDIDEDIIPQIMVRESPTLATHVIVPARATPTSPNGTVSVTFPGVTLIRGSNHICASFTLTPP